MSKIKLNEIFDIEYGNQLDLNKLTPAEHGVNFVGRSSKNLGVTDKVKLLPSVKPYPKGLITVTLGGTYLLSSFVQQGEFYTAQNIKVLTPKMEISNSMKKFYCYAIAANRFRYTSHGREANKTLDSLKVPNFDEIPAWAEHGESAQASSAKHKINTVRPPRLKVGSWKMVPLSVIFTSFERGKCNNASRFLAKGNGTSYIGAKKGRNGFMFRVQDNHNFTSMGNGIVFIGDGQGSVGFCTYQPHKFIASTTLTIGYNDKLNVYNGLFLVAILDKERFRYSFGRKYGRSKIESTTILLPVDSKGEPDWQFMEDFIKCLCLYLSKGNWICKNTSRE